MHGNFSEEVVYLITKEGKNIPSANLTHLAVKNYMEPLFGESSYGFWFDRWYWLKLTPNALIKASIFKNLGYVAQTPETIAQLKKQLEREVIQGAGLDPSLFDPNKRLSPDKNMTLQEDAKEIQQEIVGKVESEIFPFILNQELDNNSDNLRFEIEGYKE